MESSSMIPPPEAVAEARNWLELPVEVVSTILLKLGAIEILTNAQNVCSSWRKICKDPLTWRVIDMRKSGEFYDMEYDLEIMCRDAVNRSCGQLIDINIEYFGSDDLLQYIIQSSNQLRRLRIADCFHISVEGLNDAVSKLPLLEHFEILICPFSVETLKTVGRCCPLLKSLKLKKEFFFSGPGMVNDEEALVIAETMPKLLHLQICGNSLTNEGLQAILGGCPDLESLDLRQCFNLKLAGQLEKVCAEKIKILHLPHDPIDSDGDGDGDDDYFTNETNYCDFYSEGEDYGFDFSDIACVFTDDEGEDYSPFLVDSDFLYYDDFTRWY